MNAEIRSLFAKVYSKLMKIYSWSSIRSLFVNLFEAREDLFVKVYSKLAKIAREGLFVNLFEAREDFL